MDATRIGRKGRGRAQALVPPGGPVVVESSAPGPEEALMAPLPLERIALVALVLGRERAAELLEGLGEAGAQRAREYLVRLAALPSAQRQARVAVEFGVLPDAAGRLRALMVEAPEVLRREVFRGLPPYHRSLFPERRMEPPDPAVTPGVRVWAERLIREATR